MDRREFLKDDLDFTIGGAVTYVKQIIEFACTHSLVKDVSELSATFVPMEDGGVLFINIPSRPLDNLIEVQDQLFDCGSDNIIGRII